MIVLVNSNSFQSPDRPSRWFLNFFGCAAVVRKQHANRPFLAAPFVLLSPPLCAQSENKGDGGKGDGSESIRKTDTNLLQSHQFNSKIRASNVSPFYYLTYIIYVHAHYFFVLNLRLRNIFNVLEKDWHFEGYKKKFEKIVVSGLYLY